VAAAPRPNGAPGLYVVKLAEVSDRNQAEALRDSLLLVPESDRPLLEADEFHVVDLLGLSVIEQASQTLIGTVKDVIPAGNDLLEVQLDPAWLASHAPAPEVTETPEPDTDTESKSDRKARPRKAKPPTVLIPFVKEIVPVVDLVQKRLEIVPPAGLFEINR
jgi:16S rRNA processing protein RimM